jgi:hypothetical protein
MHLDILLEHIAAWIIDRIVEIAEVLDGIDAGGSLVAPADAQLDAVGGKRFTGGQRDGERRRSEKKISHGSPPHVERAAIRPC